MNTSKEPTYKIDANEKDEHKNEKVQDDTDDELDEFFVYSQDYYYDI